VKVDLRKHVLADGTDYTTINPKGCVPLLELDDGQRLSEAAVILQYIADRKPGSLAPAAGTMERYRVMEWLNFITSELHKGYSPLFNPKMPGEAKEIFVEMFDTGDTPDAIAERRGLKAAPTDAGELEQWCRDAIAANTKALAEFKSGKDSAINAFKGPVMKAAKGKANPKLVDETLRRLLAAT